MKTICFSLCAALCLGAIVFHEIVGAPMLLAPLEASGLDKNVVGMLSFSWHADVVLMLGMGSLFGCAAYNPDNRLLGLIATAMSLGLGINAYGMAMLFDPVMLETSAPVIWTVIPLIGIAGLLSK